MKRSDLLEMLRSSLEKIVEEIEQVKRSGIVIVGKEEIEYKLDRMKSSLNQAKKLIYELGDTELEEAYRKIEEKTKGVDDRSLVENISEIKALLWSFDGLITTKGKEIGKRSGIFRGREENHIARISQKFWSLKRIISEMGEECSRLENFLPYSIESSEIIDLLRSLELGGEIWTSDLIARISGLRNVAGELYTEEVKLRGEAFQLLDEESKPLELLLLHYPPFEPIHRNVGGIIGRYIWLLELKNGEIKPQEVANETAKLDENNRLTLVEPKDLRDLKEVIMKIEFKKKEFRSFVFVKYGSKKLFDELKGRTIEEVQKRYDEYVRRKRGRMDVSTYSATNLSYVWFCLLGRGMSTDPYDLDCPFIENCTIGKSRGRCDKWSWRRRLFPKVYVSSEIKISPSSMKNLEEDLNFLFIKPVAARGVQIWKQYKSAQWYMPTVISEGPVVKAEFSRPIVENLKRTNFVGFKIPLSIVESIVDTILEEDNSHKPEITVLYPDRKVTLDKVLISKFYIYSRTRGGFDTFSFLSKASRQISKDFENFKKNLSNKELKDYLIKRIGHTLAHLFLIFISNSLEIEMDDLIYVFSESEDELLVAVAENSMLGSIDIFGHLKHKFGSLNNMIYEFLTKTVKLLDEHVQELRNFSKNQVLQGRSELNLVAEKVKMRYEDFVAKGLIMDATNFINHLVLSEEDKKIAEELKIDIGKVRDLLLDAINVSGINTCLDGCVACIMLDRRCTEPLLQNLNLSLNLSLYFLRILLGEEIKGRGNKIGIAILNQAKESLFAFSPYIDDEGANFLSELAQRGVKITLVTYDKFASKYKNILNNPNVSICALKKPKHYKFYIIDRRILVNTSQNLSNLSSINNFRIQCIKPEDAESYERAEIEDCDYVR